MNCPELRYLYHSLPSVYDCSRLAPPVIIHAIKTATLWAFLLSKHPVINNYGQSVLVKSKTVIVEFNSTEIKQHLETEAVLHSHTVMLKQVTK